MEANEEAELVVMTNVLRELRPLQRDEQLRVLNWIGSKLDIEIGQPRAKARQSTDERVDDADPTTERGGGAAETFAEFADLCAAANPTSDADKALVAGFWFQKCKGGASFGSQECNTQLRHYGTPIGNITRAFDYLQEASPKLAVQLKKSGNTKQARKTYKLTHHGLQRVKEMIGG
jgi:hypothetical protein